MTNPRFTKDVIQRHRTPVPRSWRTTALASALVVAIAGMTAYYLWSHFGKAREHSSRAKEHIDEEFLYAKAAFSAGRLDEADAILARLARRRAPTIGERLLRAEIARQRGLFDQAVASLAGFSGSDSETALIWRTRGMLEIERDRPRAAEAALLHSLTLDSRLGLARRDLINLYTLESRQSELRAQFRALAATTDLSFNDLYLWCLGRRVDVGPAELAAKLERMSRNDPDAPSIRLALTENLRRLGRLDDAERAVAPLPESDPEARAARARLELDRGAVDAARRLLEEGPADNPAISRLRGRLSLAERDEAAVGHYRAALAGDPDDRDTLFGLASALRLAGKAGEAQTYLQSAHDRDQLEMLIENARSLSRREDPTVLRAIGDACRSLGRLHQARAWYRLALSRDPASSDLQKRLFELDTSIGDRRSQRSGTITRGRRLSLALNGAGRFRPTCSIRKMQNVG
jgi:tetratricopeptide (TPR) repeat protein